MKGPNEPRRGPARLSMEYRRDIDGLRAVAVIPVVLFHLKGSWMPGGFVGVDIFFVISGYLITTVLLAELDETGRLSIARFYERRIRRIFPALFAVLGLSAVAAVLLFLPADLIAYARSLLWTAFFSSNMWFSTQGGYFTQPAATRPLLHTWSLAVEEQFYVLYPLFLVLVLRLGRRRFGAAIGAALLASLAMSIWAVDDHLKLSYFIAPTRAWELLIGAFLATGTLPAPRSAGLASGVGLMGLALIGLSLVWFNGSMPFPGAWALVPTVGAALVIYAGTNDQSLTHRLLGLAVVVGIGLLSYSLYLWHWVTIVFARYYVIRPLVDAERVLVLIASLGLAWLSWRFVERPFRGRAGVGTRTSVFAGAAVASGLVLAGAFALAHGTGLPQRFTPEALRLAAAENDYGPRFYRCMNSICSIGAEGAEPSFMLWGDSHARALVPLFEERAKEAGLAGFMASWNGCPPLLTLRRYEPGFESCTAFNNGVLDRIRTRHIRMVFLHARWALYVEGARYKDEDGEPAALSADLSTSDNAQIVETLLDQTLDTLQQAQVRVVLIAGTPEVGINVPSALARSDARPMPLALAPSASDFTARQGRALDIIRRVAGKHGVRVVYPHEPLCGDQGCDIIRDQHPLYMDADHLSLHALPYLRPLVSALLP